MTTLKEIELFAASTVVLTNAGTHVAEYLVRTVCRSYKKIRRELQQLKRGSRRRGR
jgi:hypothetical protein